MASPTVTPTPEVTNHEPKKFIVDYQATAEDGTAIGKPTHLEADTYEEIIEKMKQAHIAATRALARQNEAFNKYKQLKVTPKPAADATPATTEQRVDKLEKESDFVRGQRTALEFMRGHVADFYPCEANAATLKEWIHENDLEWTADNLEIAFEACRSLLAPIPPKNSNFETPVVETAVNNGSAINTEIAEHTAQPPAQTRQPGFGMQPGTGTGTRPANNSTTAGKMTKKDVLEKRKKDPQWWKAQLADPVKLAALNAILARG